MALEPMRNHLIVSFFDVAEKGFFRDKTSWGFDLGRSLDRSAQTARWGVVLAVGPDTKEIVKGDYVCIEPLMWTENVDLDGLKVWRTDESKVMLVSKEQPQGIN